MGGLNAYEDDIEPCSYHQLHQIVMIGQLYGCLRVEGEGMPPHLHPFDDGREDLLLQLFLVPDKIVVNKEDLALNSDA